MPKKLESCVKKVKATSAAKAGRVNPYAVCSKSTGMKPHGGRKK